jgi:hypothetical protein
MPTNGKRFRAEMAESQLAKTQNKNLNQEEKAQRFALAAGGVAWRKPGRSETLHQIRSPPRPLHAMLDELSWSIEITI